MESSHSIDEVALNTLLADGVDVPTAYAANVRDSGAQLSAKPSDKTQAAIWKRRAASLRS